MARRNPLPSESIFDLSGTPLEGQQPTVGVVASPAGRQSLYFDLETAPDEQCGGPMGELFGLDPIRPRPEPEASLPVTPAEALLDPEQFCSQDMKAIDAWMKGKNPPEAWLQLLLDTDAKVQKNGKLRKGLVEAVTAVREVRDGAQARHDVLAWQEEIADRRKLLSVTPEYCRIVAMGWAVGGGEPTALVANEEAGERRILEQFWTLAARHSPIIGFNVVGFDLTVIRVRSILLGVRPTRCFADLKPWDQSTVVDLMALMFAKRKAMKLKDVVRLYGIDIPAGDADGSDVYEMVQTNPESLRRYVCSDVHVTRELHRKGIGTWWV